MGLEVAPFVQDLVTSNPISGDDLNQGDDHIRLLKATLKATFPTATRALYTTTAESKTASYTVVAADENKSFYIDCTAGVVTITLPVLTVGAAGFTVRLIKADATTNPIFVVVAGAAAFYSGPTSVTKARRCITGTPFSAVWSGGSWFVERCEKTPIGTVLPFAGATLPTGYEWPNGQTLASVAANYPEYAAVVTGSGATVDMRGRSPFGKTNMGGTDNGLLSTVPGTTLWGSAGGQSTTLVQANLGAWNFACSGFTFTGSQVGTIGSLASGYNLDHTHPYTAPSGQTAHAEGTLPNTISRDGTAATTGGSSGGTLDHIHYVTAAGTINHGSAAAGGSSTAFTNLPPMVVLNFILVVEMSTSWLKENSSLALFLGGQFVAVGGAVAAIIAYSVRLETRVAIMETRGAAYTVERLTKIETRLTVIEQQVVKSAASIERMIDVWTRELKK